MKRVCIVGSGGSGKSTFATELGRLTGIDVIHLDHEYWRPNWEPTPADEWKAKIVEILSRDSWIMDGNFGGTREMRMRAADTIIFLDLPRRVCLYRILKRMAKYYGRNRPDMAEGCNERFDWQFIGWVWNYPKRSKARLLAEIGLLQDAKVVVLKTTGEVRDYLNDLRKD